MALIESPAVAMGAIILKVNFSFMIIYQHPITKVMATFVQVICFQNSQTTWFFLQMLAAVRRTKWMRVCKIHLSRQRSSLQQIKSRSSPGKLEREKTLLQSTTFFKGEGMESIKIYSQKDPLNVAWGGHPTRGAHLLLVDAKREIN